MGLRWVARSKISFSLEIFNLARNLEFFRSLGPLGNLRSRTGTERVLDCKIRRSVCSHMFGEIPRVSVANPRFSGGRPEISEISCYSQHLAILGPQTLQNKGKCKMTNRPYFTPCVGGGIPHPGERYNVCLQWCRDTRTVTRVRHHILC